MKNIIKAHWKGILMLLVLIFVLSWIGVSNCTSDNSDTVIQNTDTGVLRAQIVDSMRTVGLMSKNAAIDSVRSVEAQKAQVAHHTSEISLRKANKLQRELDKKKAENDSLKSAKAPCEVQLDKCNEMNTTLEAISAQKDTTIEELEIEAESYSRQLYLCDQQNTNLNLIIQSKDSANNVQKTAIAVYKKQLSKKDNVFKKAEKWIFGVAGAVIAILIIK